MSVTELPIERISPVALEQMPVRGHVGENDYRGRIITVLGATDRRRYHVDCGNRTVVVRPALTKHHIEIDEDWV